MPLKFKANQTEYKLNAIVSEMESDVDSLQDCSSNEELREVLQSIAQHCSNIDLHLLEDRDDG